MSVISDFIDRVLEAESEWNSAVAEMNNAVERLKEIKLEQQNNLELDFDLQDLQSAMDTAASIENADIDDLEYRIPDEL